MQMSAWDPWVIYHGWQESLDHCVGLPHTHTNKHMTDYGSPNLKVEETGYKGLYQQMNSKYFFGYYEQMQLWFDLDFFVVMHRMELFIITIILN